MTHTPRISEAYTSPVPALRIFEAGHYDRQIHAIAQEGARNHDLLNVSVVDFVASKLTIPAPDEQCAISDVLNTAEAEEHRYRDVMATLQPEKCALMQQLLTGKRRVKVEEAA